MSLISVRETAQKWGIAPRRVQLLCNEGRISGAQRVGNAWVIPEDAEKPEDARKKQVEKSAVHINQNIRLERIWAMPNKNTFEVKPIHDLIVDELTEGTWIDPFANRNKLATITNDLNTDFDTDYHIDALDFLKLFENESVDGVLYDPPYSPRQVSECYNNVGYNVTWDTTKASFWGNHKREISRIVKIGGKVITFGWNSGGIGYKYGFEITRILIVPHGGWHNDTICTVEVKTHAGVNDNMAQPIANERNTMPEISIFDTDVQLVDYLKRLPSDFWDFKEEDTHEFTHGLHSYPAMMVSPISRNIIKILTQFKHVDSLLDPFSGSGTVLVEGILSGIQKVSGNDINPLALLLCKVKTTPISGIDLQSAYSTLEHRLESLYEKYDYIIHAIDDYMAIDKGLDLTAKENWGTDAPKYISEFYKQNLVSLKIPDFKNIGYWFRPRVIVELSIIKSAISEVENKDIRDFFYVAMSEIIRLVSNRRNGEFKMFRMTPEKVAKFNPDTKNEFLKTLQRNIQKMSEYADACDNLSNPPSVTIYREDACELPSVPNDQFDLIITSPPYGDSRTTVAYGEYSRLSMQWIDIFDLSEKEIMGVDKSLMGGQKFRNGFEYTVKSQTLHEILEQIKDADLERAGDVFSFYNDLEKSIATIAKKTKKDGYHFWVVGNRTVKGITIPTDQIIAEIAKHYGMQYVYTVERNIINKVMPAVNSPTNETGKTSATMTGEHIVILRKL